MIYQEKIKIPSDIIEVVFGAFDSNMIMIEKELQVAVVNRGEYVIFHSDNQAHIKTAKKIVGSMIKKIQGGDDIDEQFINYLFAQEGKGAIEAVENIQTDIISRSFTGKPIKAKTIGQQSYIQTIKDNTIIFGVGPAGTGKTYLAMAMAVEALKRNQVNRIVLTRPAIEAGEKLGFLPGDLQEKVDPYLRPLYDALYEMLGGETVIKYMEKGIIEVAPLAYMRGRTLDSAFIVLDEAQNTTPEQMKMFLTRLGFGSKAVITGDVTQIDLPSTKHSGLNDALRVLGEIEGIGKVALTHEDVVRHPLIQQIILSYERDEKQKEVARLLKMKEKENKDKG